MSEEREQVEVIDAGAIELMTRGEIDVQIKTAKQYPRSVKRFKETALAMATLDEDTAASCMYAVPRAGKTIEGPSARFAEICAQAWGNIRVASRSISEGQTFVSVQSVCHDLESNVAIGVEVKRRITDRDGKRYKEDGIGLASSAGISIAIRNSVLKVIPKAFWKSIYEEARRTAIGDVKTLASKRADMVGAYQKMGVSAAQLAAAVGKAGVEDIGLDELAALRGIWSSLKEGEITVEQAFPPVIPTVGVAQQPGESRSAAVARGRKAKPAEPEKRQEDAKAENVDADTAHGRQLDSVVPTSATPAAPAAYEPEKRQESR